MSQGSKLPPAPFTELSNEEAILSYIFDPRRAFIGTSLPSDTPAAPPKPKTTSAEEIEHEKLSAAEKVAVTMAENGDFDSALGMLDKLIESEGKSRASAYNNRAQVKRLKNDMAAAKADLDKCIELAHTYLDVSGRPDSLIQFHRNVLKQAYTQRAICHHSLGNKEAEESDITAAAAFGSTLARIMTTGVNPYAALCQNAFSKMTEVNETTATTTE